MKDRETSTPANWQLIVHRWAQGRGLGGVVDSHRQFEYATVTRNAANRENRFPLPRTGIGLSYVLSTERSNALSEEIELPGDRQTQTAPNRE
jgi:hypothetical protein